MQLLTAETKSTTWRNFRLNVKIVHVFGEIVYFGAKWYFLGGNIIHSVWKQARKPRSYASLKLRPSNLLTHSLTRVKSRATSVAKNQQMTTSNK